MNIKELSGQLKSILNESEYSEFDELVDYINECTENNPSLKLIFSTGYKSNDGIIYLDNIHITDSQSYWVVDGRVIDNYTASHGLDYSDYETKEYNKEDYIFLLDVDYNHTYIDEVIKKSAISSIENQRKIKNWLVASAYNLFKLGLEE